MRRVARKNLLQKQRATFLTRGRGRTGKATVAQQLQAKPDSSVCVIRKVGGIGDVLMLTPTLREVKRRWPACELTFAIDMHTTGGGVYEQLVRNCPFVDHLIDARYVLRGKYDMTWDASAVCLRYERKGLPAINRIDLFARAAGIGSLANRLPFYQVEEQEQQWAKIKHCHVRTVFLHTASNEDKRCWPIEHCLELVRACQDMPVRFLVMDFNGKYQGWNKEPNCTDVSRCSVREMAALIQQAEVFIGPDSGPMHMAGALCCRSIVLFGSIPPAARINHYPSHQAITSNAACAPCWYNKCPYDVKCMKDITVQMVESKLRRIVDET